MSKNRKQEKKGMSASKYRKNYRRINDQKRPNEIEFFSAGDEKVQNNVDQRGTDENDIKFLKYL